MGVIMLFVGEWWFGYLCVLLWFVMLVVDGGVKCLFVFDELCVVCVDVFDFVM